MSIVIKKSKLEAVLLTIASYDQKTQTMSSGLLKEDITLGTKRLIQKIHKGVLEHFTELAKDVEEIRVSCLSDKKEEETTVVDSPDTKKVNKKAVKKTEETPLVPAADFDRKKFDKEIKELLEEEVKLDLNFVDIKKIEDIKSSTNYDFEIIELFAK